VGVWESVAILSDGFVADWRTNSGKLRYVVRVPPTQALDGKMQKGIGASVLDPAGGIFSSDER